MKRILAGVLAAAVVAVAAPSLAASQGRPVPTDTVILPGGDRAMPSIPPDGGDGVPDLPDGPETAGPPPPIEYDVSKLPMPVKRLREQIIEAASTGDPEKLRPIIAANGEPPELSFNDNEDPVESLKSLSGDAEGREILAILIEVLEAGYVHVDAGTPEELYIWPYFARYPVDTLTAPQIVELFKLVLAGDYEDMKTYGVYNSYRAAIAPDGTWRYFLVGD